LKVTAPHWQDVFMLADFWLLVCSCHKAVGEWRIGGILDMLAELKLESEEYSIWVEWTRCDDPV
jgi:hypothetical protein